MNKSLLLLSIVAVLSGCNTQNNNSSETLNNAFNEYNSKNTSKSTKVLPFIVDGKEYKRAFARSKKILEHKIYVNHLNAFYSNCKLSYIDKDLQPNLSSCKQFSHRKNAKASGLDWEHVIPASRYGQTLPCWAKAKTLKKNSRTYCAKVNSSYREYETDLHNLVPSIAEINRDRKNYMFSEIKGEKRVYGNVDFEIDFPNKVVEPRDSVKGDIARIAFYMSKKYGLQLTNSEIKMFTKWSKSDKVNKWEKTKNDLVNKIQGNKNVYISG